METNIVTELEKMIQENIDLKVKLTDYEIKARHWALRERLYQSELSTIRAQLQKIEQAINTTPHSKDEEYRRIVYQDESVVTNDN